MTTITLKVLTPNSGTYEVSMPGVTTVRYAALRVAEALSHDPERASWRLSDAEYNPLPEEMSVCDVTGPVYLITVEE